ncbi:MAG: hypothetical protein QGG48_08900 [Desulfatiglandales bacterium]|nr:hypothetical protein [Desulfatiglandales bacterium]
MICWHCRVVLALMIVLAEGLVTQIPKIKFDLSTEGWLHEYDPAKVTYWEFRRQFGRDDLMIIAIEPRNVFDHVFLDKPMAFHEELGKEVPHVEEIISMVNSRNTRGEEGCLIVEDLL